MSRRFAAAVLLAGAARLAEAEEPAEWDRSPRWHVMAGYGFSVKLSRGRSEEYMLLAAPGVTFPVARRLELLVEGHFARFFSPGGYMVGVVPVGGRFLFGDGRVRPYAALGAGLGWTDLVALDEIDRRFNYLLQGSVGVKKAGGGGGGWMLEARMSHISNAGTALPNLGLNSVVLLGGWHFR